MSSRAQLPGLRILESRVVNVAFLVYIGCLKLLLVVVHQTNPRNGQAKSASIHHFDLFDEDTDVRRRRYYL